MGLVNILEVFNTSLGIIAIMEFPIDVFPRINLELEETKRNLWIKIIGIAFEKPKEFLDLNVFACQVELLNEHLLKSGDVLTIIDK
ncbi:hypothetical protein LX64_03336 [Chitinophaga skermanii]|uniref:Uncharacterized protein n=1 Tax=Chitinophaga skermanii TaxID=331697 RepID=A0A327QE86_9BACT|nr:hypothetical protein [Chitinophaga skermanii]RAJ02325.1 hypothetical protein LX64_03336 [Chitinophaga skermanii]